MPVNAPFAGIISDSYGITDFDYINVSKRNVERLTFRILDRAGNVIDSNKINVTFSLLFQNRIWIENKSKICRVLNMS